MSSPDPVLARDAPGAFIRTDGSFKNNSSGGTFSYSLFPSLTLRRRISVSFMGAMLISLL